jgi:hypothetical protein
VNWRSCPVRTWLRVLGRQWVLSGHAASFTALAAPRTSDAVVDALLQLERGTLSAGCVNPDVRRTPSARWAMAWR